MQAVSATMLYGAYNTQHQTWVDGVLTAELRAACALSRTTLAERQKARAVAAHSATAAAAAHAPAHQDSTKGLKTDSGSRYVSRTTSKQASRMQSAKPGRMDGVARPGRVASITAGIRSSVGSGSATPGWASARSGTPQGTDGTGSGAAAGAAAPAAAGPNEAPPPPPPPPPQKAWLVLDGPVDSVWVEYLNPVLDDNRTLCLSSGEMLPLRPGVVLLLEADSLAHASPATVSRCGIVCMDSPGELWRHVLECWVKALVPPLCDWGDKISVTISSVFPDLVRAYTDSLMDGEAAPGGAYEGAPRQAVTAIMNATLHLLQCLLPKVGWVRWPCGPVSSRDPRFDSMLWLLCRDNNTVLRIVL